MITKDQAEAWAKRIMYADWSYEYSDDYGAWGRGRAQCQSIIKDAENDNLSIDDVLMVIDEFKNHAQSEREEYIKYYVDKIKYVFGVKDAQ